MSACASRVMNRRGEFGGADQQHMKTGSSCGCLTLNGVEPPLAGTPFSVLSAVEELMPEPATRSFTVRETIAKFWPNFCPPELI